MGRNSVIGIYRGLFRHDEWNIGIVHAPITAFLEPGARPPVSWFPPTERGRFLADPFAVARDDRLYIFCEEYDYCTRKGRIVSIELDGSTSRPKIAMELPVHMSYPYLFEHKGEIYCVPETYQAREIGLYRAEQFPHGWVKVASLVRDFAGLDGTIFEHEGRWWLACTPIEGSLDELYLWHARDLFDQWIPHSGNPVKKDIRSSRPAGTPFVHGTYVYRPAQDCSRTYGGRIVLNRVLKLSPTQFEEEPVTAIEPYENGPYPDGVHTVSAAGDVTIIDGKRLRFVPSAFRRAVTRGLIRRLSILGHTAT